MQKITYKILKPVAVIGVALMVLAFIRLPYENYSEVSTSKERITPIGKEAVSNTPIQIYGNWKNITKKDGLPSNKFLVSG